eukprot:TRINITY_DN66818_c1_g1_i2.p1 TRINITY_DN66818_c1_g1~~TRINITY_DN66818_c1_g1_i2.p1  ORF type:complete len:377 (+),score=196.54 TRINITY_DN66818_c1_g1_i2:276-1406(+)
MRGAPGVGDSFEPDKYRDGRLHRQFVRRMRKMTVFQVEAEIKRVEDEISKGFGDEVTMANKIARHTANSATGLSEYCFCKRPPDKSEMIGCDLCDDWLHLECINMTPAEANCLESYICPPCQLATGSERCMKFRPRDKVKEALQYEAARLTDAQVKEQFRRVRRLLRKTNEFKKRVDASVRKIKSGEIVSGVKASANMAAYEARQKKRRRRTNKKQKRRSESSSSSSSESSSSSSEEEEEESSSDSTEAEEESSSSSSSSSTEEEDEDEEEEEEEENDDEDFDHPYRVGQAVEVRDMDGQWFVASVKEAHADKVKVSYAGWGDEYDEDVQIATGRLAVLGTHTNHRKAPRIAGVGDKRKRASGDGDRGHIGKKSRN